MNTILLLANNRFDSAEALTILCNDIKAREDANHKLFFRKIIMGAFTISAGYTDKDGTKHLDSNNELIIFPADNEEQLEKIKLGKTIIELHNCKWVVGESEKTSKLRTKIIDWLLGAEWDS